MRALQSRFQADPGRRAANLVCGAEEEPNLQLWSQAAVDSNY